MTVDVGARWVHFFGDPLPPGAADEVGLLGGKGSSLHRMTTSGLAVPPGFTILTSCCEEYFRLNRCWPSGLESEVRQHLARLEEQTGRLFGAGRQPLLVSVRSGAARSMPGMMDTLLNCGLHPGLADDVGDTPDFWALYIQFIRSFAKTAHGIDEDAFAEVEESHAGQPDRSLAEQYLATYRYLTGKSLPASPWPLLLECINAVFDSWHSERAVAYRRRHAIRNLAGTAVSVQMMFPAEVSGVVFTRDPTRPEAAQLVIESSYGLGESVVAGDVTPDRFLASRDSLHEIEVQPGHKASAVFALGAARSFDPNALSLSPAQCEQLCRLALRVEQYFGHPVDVEWGLANGEFALLQARSIRGIETARDAESGRREEVERLKATANGQRRVWIVHNLDETLRFPTPLTWDITRNFMRGAGGFGRLYTDLGYRPGQRVREDGFLELICGRIYADPDRLAELFWDGMPLRYDPDELLRDPSLLNRAPGRFDASRADGRFLTQLPSNLWSMWRTARSLRRAERDAAERFQRQVLPPYLDYVRSQREQNLAPLSELELVDLLHRHIDRVLNRFGPESLRPGFFGGLALGRLEAMLSQLMGTTQGSTLAGELTAALEGDTTLEQESLLYKVAQGQSTLDDFLDRFGHRAVGEMELAVPRWREDPTYLQQINRWRLPDASSPSAAHQRIVARQQAARERLPAELIRWGGSCFQEQIEHDLGAARRLLPYREIGKHYLMMGYELIRAVIQQLGRLWQIDEGTYYLHLDELPRMASDRDLLTEQIHQRRNRRQAFARLDLPDVIDSADLDRLGLPRQVRAVDKLAGTAVAVGVATGTARIVLSPRDAGPLSADSILVCPSTDPGWTPLFSSIRGLIVERGGVLSHGAIVARDFGIPAVVCPDATRLLCNGDQLQVDGHSGQVLVLKRQVTDA